MPTDQCGENSKFGKTPFSTITEKVILGRNYQWIQNLGRKVW